MELKALDWITCCIISKYYSILLLGWKKGKYYVKHPNCIICVFCKFYAQIKLPWWPEFMENRFKYVINGAIIWIQKVIFLVQMSQSFRVFETSDSKDFVLNILFLDCGASLGTCSILGGIWPHLLINKHLLAYMVTYLSSVLFPGSSFLVFCFCIFVM